VLLRSAREGIDESAGEVDLGQLQLDQLGIIHIVDNHVESSESRVTQSQELFVLHELRSGYIGQTGVHFLGLGIGGEHPFRWIGRERE